MEEQLKTGTTTVGLVCKDGIVLAADKRATAGFMIVDKRAEKIHVLTDDFAVTIAGTVSDAQVIIKLIKAELKLKEIRTNKKPSVKEAANLLGEVLYHSIRRMTWFPAVAHFLMGGKDHSGFYLYDLFPDGSVTKIKDYVGSGSGSVFAYGVLESQYRADMTTADGIKLATRAVNAALQRDAASGNGLDVVIITDKEIKRVIQKELEISLL